MKKRLFFGVEVMAPWPDQFPKGRIIPELSRHLTLAFLGEVSWDPLKKQLESFPVPEFPLGETGFVDSLLFLPKHHPHVVAYHVQRLNSRLLTLQQELASWLIKGNYPVDKRPFLPHVTVARSPFDEEGWKKSFSPFPIMTGPLHLYESLGGLNYVPIWTSPRLYPFEQIAHTADIAFLIRGLNLYEIENHALTALAFFEPSLSIEIDAITEKSSLDEVIVSLNEVISKADVKQGIGLKAVSFHGNLLKKGNSILEWEMIVDV